MIITTLLVGGAYVGLAVGVVCAPLARADWHCNPAYTGVETICNDDAGRQVICFNWGQMAGKCVDAQNGGEVPHPPGA